MFNTFINESAVNEIVFLCFYEMNNLNIFSLQSQTCKHQWGPKSVTSVMLSPLPNICPSCTIRVRRVVSDLFLLIRIIISNILGNSNFSILFWYDVEIIKI